MLVHGRIGHLENNAMALAQQANVHGRIGHLENGQQSD